MENHTEQLYILEYFWVDVGEITNTIDNGELYNTIWRPMFKNLKDNIYQYVSDELEYYLNNEDI